MDNPRTLRVRSKAINAILNYSERTMTQTYTYANGKFTDDELLEAVDVFLNWTPVTRHATAADVRAASNFHLLTGRNLLKKYGDRLRVLSPSRHNSLVGYVA